MDAWGFGAAAVGSIAKAGTPAALPPMQGGQAGHDGSGWVVNFGSGSLVGSSGGAASAIRWEWIIGGAVLWLLLKK